MHFKLTQCCQLHLNKAGRKKKSWNFLYSHYTYVGVFNGDLCFSEVLFNFLQFVFLSVLWMHNLYCFLFLLSVQIYCEPLCCVFHFSYCIFQLQFSFYWGGGQVSYVFTDTSVLVMHLFLDFLCVFL